jgi:hypothetical protein
MIKRLIIPASLSLSLLAGLAGCGSSSNNPTPGDGTSVPGVVTTAATGSNTSDAMTGTTGTKTSTSAP